MPWAGWIKSAVKEQAYDLQKLCILERACSTNIQRLLAMQRLHEEATGGVRP